MNIVGSVEPLVIEDIRNDPCFSAHPGALAFPNIGSYVGVPILLASGRLFGTLCAVDPDARTLTRQQTDLLVVLARLVSTQIERDRELAERLRVSEALRASEAELARAFAVQQQINEQLERLNMTKSHFVSIVSHEFRTALTGIQGFSELMRDEEFSIAEMREFAGDINDDARRLNRMISELLDLDRMESGRMALYREPLDLNALLSAIVGRVRPTAPGHAFELRLDAALPALLADPDKLTQVITNLLSNAVKYSPDGGTITIASGVAGEMAHAQIQDQGVGLPPDALERIFERYGRVQSGATRYIQGTGLGLPISRQIIGLHGGRIWAESTAGSGSIFHFTLPLAPEATS